MSDDEAPRCRCPWLLQLLQRPTDLQFDARVTASWDFRGFLLIKIDEFAAGRFGDATFVAQRRVRHPTAKA